MYTPAPKILSRFFDECSCPAAGISGGVAWFSNVELVPDPRGELAMSSGSRAEARFGQRFVKG
ncbi:hypothetical protein, partial [Methylobacterium frigidaeris]|uniref:hypothetical protein n=1 Tax=Methylobacterium frigidaeris TaxID=2038277 RepID=UPI001A9C93DC